MRSLAMAALLLFAHNAFAGSNTADLDCTSTNTSISLKGIIPATEEGLNLTLRDKAGSLMMTDAKSQPYVVKNFA